MIMEIDMKFVAGFIPLSGEGSTSMTATLSTHAPQAVGVDVEGKSCSRMSLQSLGGKYIHIL